MAEDDNIKTEDQTTQATEDPQATETPPVDTQSFFEDGEPEVEPKEQSWDQVRQFRSELAASNRREKELTDKLDAVTQKLDTMNTQQADGDDVDLEDYDALTQEVKRLRQAEKSRQTAHQELLNGINQINQRMTQQEQAEQQRTQQEAAAQYGQRVLNGLVADMEKKYPDGKGHTNAILDEIYKDFRKHNIRAVGPGAMQEWLRARLENGYLSRLKGSSPAVSNSTKKQGDVVVDPGVGGGTPPDKTFDEDVPEGDVRSVMEAMKDHYRRHPNA